MASFFDNYYISIFNHYKKKLGKRSLNIALFYITFLELSVILVLAAFLKAFASQMKMSLISSTKFWVIYGLIVLFIIFKNWMRYNGKKRNILNAKFKRNDTSIYLLWLLPIGCFAVALILLQVQ
ncbi:hypothetical protein SAMN04489796_101704 [Winogradskyella thalassocola]|uniref:Uncharacterized protein n=1 Tax=Winogradskyella thalassocola TaxID=262004 RepID=A0A1G7XFV8_9FLAO|nr:hypothetical protein SAMN04489796_101704 [Winogradskyella thalassocola]